jgi:CHAT domain-containing protein
VLLSRRLFAFEALIHLLGRLAPQFPDSGYDAEAFAWAERTRARSFLDLLNAQGRSAEPLAPITLERAQSLLPTERAALLEYSLGDSSSSLWVVTRRSWRRFTLPPRAALQARAEILRRALGDPATAESRAARSAARALHRLLIEPAARLIERSDQLLVSPDGALARVPFEALLAADAPADAAAPHGAYLVERYAVSYTPSASALVTFAPGPRRGGARREVLAVGAPEFGTIAPHGMSGPLVPLPGTAGELSALRAVAAPRPCTVLSGAAATRERVLALPSLGRAGLIHIATHGLADPAAPERSGLWFSAPSDSEAPGFVSLGDLFGLRLSAGLVTLSACETGLGRIERGEGVIGLSRAFLAAGAHSVVVSLWSVNDRSTATLMRRFYTPLLARGAPCASALAEAKRALLADPATRSPFYWAPFVLIGAAGKLE